MSLTIVDEPRDRPEWIRETVALLAERIRADRARLLRRVARATDEELVRGDDADWGIGQIATHLLVVERGDEEARRPRDHYSALFTPRSSAARCAA